MEDRARIWIVDDSPLEAEVARITLAPAFEVTVFHEAASLLERFDTADRPEIVVTDWHMPDISGADLCAFIRTRADAAELPILVLTGTSAREELLVGLAAGANDFVSKPFVAAELIARVRTLVQSGRLHHRLAAAEEALRHEASYREKFVAILAHDLRQPLNVFTMGAGLLSEAEPKDGPTAMIGKRFAKASSRMQRMLNELLDFTRSRHDQTMPIERHASDVAEIGMQVISEIQHGQPDRDIRLCVEGPCSGDWDADRVAQIFSNLIGNALEHGTKSRPVLVTVRGDDAGTQISVENEGKAIPEAVLASVFDPFRQATTSRTGLGLGLYIVRSIARAHGGDVTVASDETCTRFVARLKRTSTAVT